MRELPRIMVAPNGARKTTSDHPTIPVTIEQTVSTAQACFRAGADGIHAHIRGDNEEHILDAGLYRELIGELNSKLPKMYVQVTTESVGIYSPSDQRKLLYDLKPPAVSIGLNEIFSDGEVDENRRLFDKLREWGTATQIILYAADEVTLLKSYIERKIIPKDAIQLLFVLGRYTQNQQSPPTDLDPFLARLKETELSTDWAVCAFGLHETRCLLYANQHGGKMRIGFENNFQNMDGSVAKSNEERVSELVAKLRDD